MSTAKARPKKPRTYGEMSDLVKAADQYAETCIELGASKVLAYLALDAAMDVRTRYPRAVAQRSPAKRRPR